MLQESGYIFIDGNSSFFKTTTLIAEIPFSVVPALKRSWRWQDNSKRCREQSAKAINLHQMCCFGHWLHMYTKLKKYVYCILLKKGVCVCVQYIYIWIYLHIKISLRYMLWKWFSKSYTGTYHIHISCDIYIYRFHKRIPMDFGPLLQTSFRNVTVQNMDCWLLTTAPTPFQLHHVCALVYPSLKFFAVVNTPISQIWGRWGGAFIILISDRESRSPKKSETAKIIEFHTDLRCLMFHSKAWDQEKISGKKISSEL